MPDLKTSGAVSASRKDNSSCPLTSVETCDRASSPHGYTSGYELRVCPVASKASIAACTPNLGPDPFGWTCLDHASEVPARDAQHRGLLHVPCDILDITRIDRSRHDPHQRSPLVGDRGGHLRQLEDGGIAKGLEPYRPHDLPL
jgi:hypothetical protein